uniref:Uncharacterized protein n=1 Tax=Arundo donax TaxID=35708 RepID=A0A0A9GPW8_ARUDO
MYHGSRFQQYAQDLSSFRDSVTPLLSFI